MPRSPVFSLILSILFQFMLIAWNASPAAADSRLAEGIEWYFGAGSLGGYEEIAGEFIAVYDPINEGDLEERFQVLFGDELSFLSIRPAGVSVETLTQADVGLLWRLNQRFTLDVGFGFGSGRIRQDFNLQGTLADGSPQAMAAFVDSDIDVFSGNVAGRLYPLRTERFSPWVSFGALGRILRGQHGMWHIPSPFPWPFPDHAFEVDGTDTHGNTDLMVGAGLDVQINRRLSLDLFARQSFTNGHNIGLALKIRAGGLSPDEDPEIEDPLDVYAWAGRQHNEGMDFVFEYLARTIQEPVSTARFRELTIAGAQEFARLHRLESPTFDAVLEGVAITESPDGTGPTGNARLDSIFEEEGRRLSDGQRSYLLELLDLAEASPSSTRLEHQARRLARRALSELGEDAAIPVLSSASLMVHSAAYWERNDTRWAARLAQWIEPPGGTDPHLFFKKIKWKDVGKADLVAFVGSLVKGIVFGAESAIVGGVAAGVGGSAAEVVKQLF